MNGFKVENAFMISSIETLILLSFNGLGLIGLIIVTVITFVNKKNGPYGHVILKKKFYPLLVNITSKLYAIPHWDVVF